MVKVGDNEKNDVNYYCDIKSIMYASSKINNGGKNLAELERKVRTLLDIFQRENLSADEEKYKSMIEDLINKINEMSRYASKYSSDINNFLNVAIIEKEKQLNN